MWKRCVVAGANALIDPERGWAAFPGGVRSASQSSVDERCPVRREPRAGHADQPDPAACGGVRAVAERAGEGFRRCRAVESDSAECGIRVNFRGPPSRRGVHNGRSGGGKSCLGKGSGGVRYITSAGGWTEKGRLSRIDADQPGRARRSCAAVPRRPERTVVTCDEAAGEAGRHLTRRWNVIFTRVTQA